MREGLGEVSSHNAGDFKENRSDPGLMEVASGSEVHIYITVSVATKARTNSPEFEKMKEKVN